MPVIYRSVIQKSQPTAEAAEMLSTFPLMVNDCVRMGIEKQAFSYSAVKEICLPRMREYGVHDAYMISAMFDAANLLKRHRTESTRVKVRPPRVRRRYVSVSLGVYLVGGELQLPARIMIPLNKHTLSILTSPGNEIVSSALTETTCSVIYRKFVKQIVPQGMVAIDLNLENVTTFDTDGQSARYDISRLVEVHELYRRVKSHFRRNDARIKGEIWRKYARLEWEKKQAVLHSLSSAIVESAGAKKQQVVMEDLRGLRDMYRRRSGSSPLYLSKMNAWPFRVILHQISYKAESLGLPVLVVDPEWTSEKCSECGGLMEQSPAEEIVVCSVCGNAADRHLNGAKNILKRGLRSRPDGFAGEAMKSSKPSVGEPSARVDANNPAGH